MDIESKLAEMGLSLPDAPAPAANYVPYVVVGNLVFVSGQISKDGDRWIKGKLGADADVALGVEAAQVCALNLLAQVKAAAGGDLSRLKQEVRQGGFVNCTGDFTDQPAVINGASDLLGTLLGAAGQHSRAAVGAPSLPFGVAVEIDGVFELS
ncbi:MAG: RidA family protein [Pseudomonadota bacterium]